MVRLFAAVVPPPEALEHLGAFLEPRRAAADFRWTRPEHYHLTLAFMADADDLRVEEYVERLADSLDGLAAPRLRLAGAVVFPDVSRARVLAVGLTAAEPPDEPDAVPEGAPSGPDLLARAATRARNAAVASGIEVDGQRFRAHLTLARTGGRPVEMTSWVRLLETYRGPAWRFDTVQVVASHLGEGPRRSPRYETLAEISFG